MSGFDTARAQSGIVAMAKQHGSILRGFGPPVPQAGVVGDLYIDVMTFQLFEKREINGLDDWGHFLFLVPALYHISLKWFGPSAPDNTLGVVGDYFLQWAGYDNYGMQPVIWGPKLWTGWPENGDGGDTPVATNTAANVYPLGISDEGPFKADIAPNTLIAIGILDEYVIPFPITAGAGEPVKRLGSQSSGNLVVLAINTLYTAEDEHAL